MDLFAVADANAAALQNQFDSLLSSLNAAEADDLTRFADGIKSNGRIAMNMRQTTLNSFLAFGHHQNIYEWARERGQRSTKPVEEILREKLGAYYERRVAFDQHFQDGEQFRYGALNSGGLGATYYGDYCVVLADRVSSGQLRVAYLRSDSLNTYLLPGPSVDEAAIRRDAAPHTHKHCRATLKHAGEIPSWPDEKWPSLLCSDKDYVEAVFVGEMTPDDLEAVRMSRSDYDLFFHYAFEEFREKLSEVDRFRVESFVMMLQHLKKRGIPLEEIDDA